MELLRRECLAFANDGYAILTVEIDALDGAVVLARNAHVGPVNVCGFKIDDDAIWHSGSAEDDFSVRPIGVSRINPAAACFEEEQAASRCFAAVCTLWFQSFSCAHIFLNSFSSFRNSTFQNLLGRARFWMIRRGCDDADRTQTIDFFRVESEFLENFVVVFSQLRRSLCRYFCDAVHLNRTADCKFQVFSGAF